MRVLVVGTVPPPGGASTAALGAVAAGIVERGDTLEVWSPNPRSVAHRHLGLSGAGLGIRLALSSRRFDAAVVRIEAGVPLRSDATRLERAVALLVLGAGLSLFREVTLRLDHPVPIPGGLGGRATELLWRCASSIVVGAEEDRSELLVAPGVRAERVSIEEHKQAVTSRELGFDRLEETAGREQVLGIIQERSAQRRAIDAALEEIAFGAERPARAPAPVRASAGAWWRALLRRARRELART